MDSKTSTGGKTWIRSELLEKLIRHFMRGSRGWDRGSGPSLKNHKIIRIS